MAILPAGGDDNPARGGVGEAGICKERTPEVSGRWESIANPRSAGLRGCAELRW